VAKLVRVDEKTYARLRRLAGRIQAASGRRTSLCDAIRNLLDCGGSAAVKKAKPVRPTRRSGRGHSHELVPYFLRREIH